MFAIVLFGDGPLKGAQLERDEREPLASIRLTTSPTRPRATVGLDEDEGAFGHGSTPGSLRRRRAMGTASPAESLTSQAPEGADGGAGVEEARTASAASALRPKWTAAHHSAAKMPPSRNMPGTTKPQATTST